MKMELEKKLMEKYPKIFRQKDLPPNQSLMCFGIECGDGWYDILDTLCESIQRYVDSAIEMGELRKENEKNYQVEAVQIKEKFGGLRFYTSGNDDIVEGMIHLAEIWALKTCEYCGKPGKMRDDGWLVTLCDECDKKRKEEKA